MLNSSAVTVLGEKQLQLVRINRLQIVLVCLDNFLQVVYRLDLINVDGERVSLHIWE